MYYTKPDFGSFGSGLYPPHRGEDIPQSVFSDDYQSLLRLLLKTRKSQGFTQQQVAQALGVTHSTIGKIERGERRIDVIELRNFCLAIGVPLIMFIHQLESSLEFQTRR